MLLLLGVCACGTASLFKRQMPRRVRAAEVSLFEAIRSYSDVSATSFLVGLACLIALADVGCAVALYGVVHDWAPGSWGPLVILKNTWGGQVCFLWLLSCGLFPASIAVCGPLGRYMCGSVGLFRSLGLNDAQEGWVHGLLQGILLVLLLAWIRQPTPRPL